MNARSFRRPWQRVATFGLVYFGLGVGSAIISNDLESAPVQASIRVGIFLVAVAFFYWHFRVELGRSDERLRASALITSGALAFGTLLLAVYAVSTAWWDSSHLPTSLLSALLIWPVATSLPAFLAALVLGSVMLRIRRRAKGLVDGNDAA
jgi:vacuolar-type H+-ATPase subunit I/STV1